GCEIEYDPCGHPQQKINHKNLLFPVFITNFTLQCVDTFFHTLTLPETLWRQRKHLTDGHETNIFTY
ncbi:MAG: hypothetical protein K1X81_11550, partial [Bacteroidia bacterium]|nr:hypothetical protein [Bacteroidia bacterium]